MMYVNDSVDVDVKTVVLALSIRVQPSESKTQCCLVGDIKLLCLFNPEFLHACREAKIDTAHELAAKIPAEQLKTLINTLQDNQNSLLHR